ncbi:hypothetical protein RMCBS344292_04875 [Rhizopus microsporus]|nr:hypothetical protein RMCBS344292_04875 [Rhizopus microsporus]
MVPNGNFFRLTDFDRFYFGHENKMHLWNTAFNIGKLDTGVLANPATSRLAYSMKTDGHMISILFEKTSVEFVPQAKNDLIRQKRNIDFTNRTKDLYPLYKEPTGITANDRIIGIDPGVRDIIYAVDCDVDELVDKRSTKEHPFAYSNASYKLCSGMNWIKQKELASRLNSDIQASYDQLKTRNTYTNQSVMVFYILLHQHTIIERLYFALFNSVRGFMRNWQYREHKRYAYSNRKMAEDHVARVVLGQAKVDEVFKLANCSSKSTRRKKRKRFRRQRQNELRGNEDTRRTIVAYGDASIRGTYRGNTPVPHRINGVENRPRRKCLDEEGRILHWSSRCPESRVVRQNNIIYPLKLCNQCPVNGNNDLYWKRDVNAAANIRSVLIEYIRSNFNIRSLPAALSRGQQD